MRCIKFVVFATVHMLFAAGRTPWDEQSIGTVNGLLSPLEVELP